MKKELWLRLHQYRFEDLVPAALGDRVASVFGSTDASTHAFAAKVARKQRWTTSFALRAIAEYKKFVYLGNVASFSVTPPKAIDAVWHEHLLFSRAYRNFCRDVLGRDFDHHPELLPAHEQTDVFQAQYAATLALYRSEFNAVPPADVWGTPKFGTPGRASEAQRPAQAGDTAPNTTDDMPLFMRFQEYDSSGSPGSGEWVLSGGGGFVGGGGGSNWTGDAAPADPSSSDASGSSDSGPSDGGPSDSGSSDAGSSCSGGSGCSSSCSSSD